MRRHWRGVVLFVLRRRRGAGRDRICAFIASVWAAVLLTFYSGLIYISEAVNMLNQ